MKRLFIISLLFLSIALLGAEERALALKTTTTKSTNTETSRVVINSGHSSTIHSIAYSPDGKYLASGSSDNSIIIWDLATKKEVRRFYLDMKVETVIFTPDGKNIIAASYPTGNGTKKWNIRTGECVLEISDAVDCIALSRDGKYLGGTKGGYTAAIWDANTGKLLFELNDHKGGIYTTAFSNDGKYLATGASDKTIKIWNTANGSLVRTLTGHTDSISTVKYSLDGKYIASGSDDKTVKIWNANTGKFIGNIFKHNSQVQEVFFSPDSKYLSSCSDLFAESLQVWDFQKNEIVYSGDEESETLSYSPDGKTLALGGYGSIRFFNTTSWKEESKITSNSNLIDDVTYSPDGKHIALPNCIIDSSTGVVTKKLKGSSMARVAYSPDGKTIVSDRIDLNAYDANTGAVLFNKDHYYEGGTYSLKFSPEGKYLTQALKKEFEIGKIEILDTTTCNVIHTIKGNKEEILNVSFSPDGKYLASASKNEVKVRRTSDWTLLKTLPDNSYVQSVDFSPDSKYLASGSWDKSVKIYDTSSFQLKKTFTEEDGYVYSVVFSPDGKYIANSTGKNSIHIRDSNTGNIIHILSGHTDTIPTIKYNPDGSRLVSASSDGTVKIWNIQNGELLATVINCEGDNWLTYTPDGFFCGSEWAMQNMLHLVDGMDVIGIDQVYDKLYRPDIIAAKLKGEDINDYTNINYTTILQSGNPPTLSFTNIPSQSQTRDICLELSVQDHGGGIGRVMLSLNGKKIQIASSVPSSKGNNFSLSHTVTLQDGNNSIECYAYNSSNEIESRHASGVVTWHGKTEKPNLYVLAVAVNKYRDRSLWLNYAVPDAELITTQFKKNQGGLYKTVNVTSLTDGDVTKESIENTFNSLSEKVTADDVFVFYISGHGTTYNDGDYYFLPANFRYMNADSIPSGGVSKTDLTKNLSVIRAGKTLVILDTCNSGAFLTNPGQRGMTEKTAIDRLTRATGHATLAASSDVQSAMEGYNKHGIFTYVLAEGLNGKADINKDGYVSLQELSSYIDSEVPERSMEKWGYEQIPQRDLRKQDFPIAKGEK